MNWADIIARFELQVDDSATLSSEESLALANEVLFEIYQDRDWEFLKTSYTGVQSTSVPYIDLPSDFRNICPNYMGGVGYYSGNMGFPVGWTGSPYWPNVSAGSSSVVFVDTTFIPYQVIPFSQRRSYRNMNQLCYIDFSTNRLYFIVAPTAALSVEYDYIKNGEALTTSTSPLFPAQFHDMISLGMSYKFNALEQTNKAESYQDINRRSYEEKLSRLRMLDANQKTQLA